MGQGSLKANLTYTKRRFLVLDMAFLFSRQVGSISPLYTPKICMSFNQITELFAQFDSDWNCWGTCSGFVIYFWCYTKLISCLLQLRCKGDMWSVGSWVMFFSLFAFAFAFSFGHSFFFFFGESEWLVVLITVVPWHSYSVAYLESCEPRWGCGYLRLCLALPACLSSEPKPPGAAHC